MFDWGDTIMVDDPRMDTPMCQWPMVEIVDGAEEVLRALHARRTIVMATGAAQSGEADIRAALQRVNLAHFFDRIFCFKNTGLRKPSVEFYRYILEALQTSPADVLMVGDNFASDILGANRLGIAGVWLNHRDAEDRSGEQYWTIHHLRDLLSFLNETG
jgi:putative hydrolase of the HAD superfamily